MHSPPTLRREHRPIRSFVLRQGRLTTGQQRAFAELWPRWGLHWRPGEVLDVHGLFGNANPVVLEIGFGNGESLACMASEQPGRNFLGLEVHRPGIGHLLLEIERAGLNNLRILCQDAVELLRGGLPPASLDAVHLFFPDPWPKKRHHKRRIVQSEFVLLLARALKPGGTFHAATDWEPYAEYILGMFDAADDLFSNSAGQGGFVARPAWRPPTKFERRGERLGHPVRDLVYRRR
ncbi:MAG TPA: tRNA (guanosine(46)-N7)-methyltransferase TrmB [Chromatiaceae bacterium]|nr:MAG: tRNA (guanosine(46)-N7)-methyltransferase TrmB [Thiohalocapsa sp. PB-PSB1]HBG96757.1 tRNA (guanosine(46)-N7)-methyltransferase TrmB [Chromatiaceae bacterium]HCS90403.1 tRNA (guanosine(46)-N7)-methyltransferase TrmB [Chromatiaceae bacterium]